MPRKRTQTRHLLKAIAALTFITLSLTACAQTTPNIEPTQRYSSDEEGSEDQSEDYNTIAYANMVNLDAAVKYNQTAVINTVSELQIKYGEYDKALQTVNRGLEFSDDMMLIATKVELLEKLCAFEELEVLISQVVLEQSDHYSEMSLDDKMYYNYLLMCNNENNEAIENYLEIVESDVDESYLDWIYNNIGLAYLNLYEYENAKTYCLEALKYDPGNSVTLSNLGNSYYGLDEIQIAHEHYEQALQIDPYNAYAIYGYASTAQDLEKYEIAVEAWKQYIDLLPMDSEAWYGLNECYSAMENLDGQKECLEALISLAPDDRSYAYDLLIVHQEMGTLTKPLDVIRVYHEEMGDLEANWLIAEFTYNKVSYKQGAILYEALLTNYVLTYSDYSTLAEDLYYQDEYELMERVFDEAEKNLSREERLEIEASLYYHIEDAENLLKVTLEIIEINPKSGYGYEYLGDAYYFAADYKNAANNYGLAVTYSEDPYYSSKAQVDSLILLGNIDEANQLNTMFLETYPDDAYGHVYQARIEMKRGSEEAAVQHLVTAMSLSDYLEDIFETYEELAQLKERPELESIGQ